MAAFDPQPIAPEVDPSRHGPGVGVIAPFDFVLDAELWRWTPPEVTLHVTRTHRVASPVGTAMARELRDPEAVMQATRDLMAAEPGVILYACTSASFVEGVAGEQALRRLLEDAGAPRTVTTSGAIVDALDALGVSRVGVASPYDAELTTLLAEFLEESGRDIEAVSLLDLSDSIAWVTDDTVSSLVRAAVTPAVEAVVVACTNLPTASVLPGLEAELDRPIVSANLASMWSSLRAVDATDRDRPERLFGVAGAGV